MPNSKRQSALSKRVDQMISSPIPLHNKLDLENLENPNAVTPLNQLPAKFDNNADPGIPESTSDLNEETDGEILPSDENFTEFHLSQRARGEFVKVYNRNMNESPQQRKEKHKKTALAAKNFKERTESLSPVPKTPLPQYNEAFGINLAGVSPFASPMTPSSSLAKNSSAQSPTKSTDKSKSDKSDPKPKLPKGIEILRVQEAAADEKSEDKEIKDGPQNGNDKNKLETTTPETNIETSNNLSSLEKNEDTTTPTDTATTNVYQQPEIEDDDDLFDSSDDEEWKQMNTELDYSNVYNMKGNKLNSFIHSEDNITPKEDKKPKTTIPKQLSKAVNYITGEQQNQIPKRNEGSADTSNTGYTRIAAEAQASKFNKMDQRFDFLFQNENSNLRKLHNASTNSLPNNKSTGDLTQKMESESENEGLDTSSFAHKESDHYESDSEEEQAELSPANQLLTTKSMLSDAQKIGYAALVKLLIVQMHFQLSEIRGSNSTKVLKKLATSQKSFTKWSIDVMNDLYDHLEIHEAKERDMIENLSCHGVEPRDLVGWLELSLEKKIQNPLLKDENNLKIISKDDDDDNSESIEKMKNKEELEVDMRWTLICDLFLILLQSSIYDSRSRNLLIRFAEAIDITKLEICQFERRITNALETEADDEVGSLAVINNTKQTWDEHDLLDEHRRKYRKQRLVAIGLATVGGGIVIGLSAGLLAPVIGAGLAAGLTGIGITGTSSFLAGTAGSAIVTAGGVATGMNIGNKGMSKRVGSVKTFEFKPLHNNGRLNLIITISGWMSSTMDDVRLPFSTVDPAMGDLYSLYWEPELLTSMGQTINILATEVLTQSIQQILGSTILITLFSGLQLTLMLTKLGYLLDNPWNVSLDRAWASGAILADTLIRKKLGVRPVTLVGFSLGSRVIYSCLLELAKRGEYGLVEDVYLFGSPYVVKVDQIALARSVVSGRFVNGYSKKDWILGYLFRATSGGLSTVAGLSPIEGIENYDCSELVTGHMGYREVMPKLLKNLGWEILDEDFIEIEQPDPEETEKQRQLISDFEDATARLQKKKKKHWYEWWKPKKKEWWEMYEEGIQENKNKKQEGENEAEGDDNNTTKTSKKDNDVLFDLDALRSEVADIEKNADKLKKLNLSPGAESVAKFREYEYAGEKKPKPPVSKALHLNEEEFSSSMDDLDNILEGDESEDVIFKKLRGNNNNNDHDIGNTTLEEDHQDDHVDKLNELSKVVTITDNVNEDASTIHSTTPKAPATRSLRHHKSFNVGLDVYESPKEDKVDAKTPANNLDKKSSKHSSLSSGEMRSFRLSSGQRGSHSLYHSPSLNLKVVQVGNDKDNNNNSGRDSINTTANEKLTTPEIKSNRFSDPYGDLGLPHTNGADISMEVFGDDDFKHIEKANIDKKDTKKPVGEDLGSAFDYDDDEEFPTEENIQMTIS
ncbi:hypothetical protein B5S33_g2121 [[Candida] boidinii]|nr:hypothetical protein B5S33_g2121 [[Candida] boidinii]